jgi:tetratricopeptide (TPR) repeat protein/serine/threonine protein kinase
MFCTNCHADTESAAGRCTRCGTPQATIPGPPPEDAETSFDTPSSASRLTVGRGLLSPGQSFGSRYHVTRELGSGGMGAVYQAWDDELGVAVALKVIRPELTGDSTAALELERRFKLELLLARQVTHKNVVRIHDLGEIDGIKYITMPYIEGRDLAHVLRTSGRLPVAKTLAIARQVAAGLQAAHDVGVVHRDLKPANVMIDGDHAVIMDFGIARSAASDSATMLAGGTMPGAVIGTLEYIAPEQARGEAVDQRADIYAFGLIVYEMIVGRQRAEHDTSLSDLMKRMQSAPRSMRTIDPAIPEGIDRVVSRCVQPDAAARYQTSAELVADLDRLDTEGNSLARLPPSTADVVTVADAPKPKRAWTAVAGVFAAATIVGLLLVAVVVDGPWNRPTTETSTAANSPPVSLAILPLRNASADRSIDWLGPSLAGMLRTEIGQSAHLRSVSSDRLDQILRDLHVAPEVALDASLLQRLATFSSADTVLSGQYAKLGDAIRIDATIHDIAHQREVSLKAEAPNQAGLFNAVSQLAQSVRQNLSLPPDVVKELQNQSLRPSTRSLDALRFYNQGVDLARQGKHAEAVKMFQSSTEADNEFALAYSKLGQSQANLGYDSDAERTSQRAVELSAKLSPPERYLVMANHARIVNDTAKAIEAYENLVKVSPEDPDVRMNLASLYESVGSFDSALDQYRKVLARDPNYVEALYGFGRVEIRRGDAQGSLEPLNRALTLAIQLDNDDAKANLLHATGVAYKNLRKREDALRYYEQALDLRRRIGDKRGIAVTLGERAQVQLDMGNGEVALTSYLEALTLQREIGDRRGQGTTLINLGQFYTARAQYDQALKLFKDSLQIQRDVGNKNSEALCLNNIGNVLLAKGEYTDALLYFERAIELRETLKVVRDIADTRHNLATTYAALGRYDQAIGEYLRALELRRSSGDTRGAAIESYSLGTIFAEQGRYGAALKSKEEALTAFRSLKERGFWLSELLGGYGNALAQMGRGREAEQPIEEALVEARASSNRVQIAQALGLQGDSAWYRGDLKRARQLFDQALKEASATTDRALILSTKVHLVKVSLQDRPTEAGAQTIRILARDADALGRKYVSVECSIYLAQALLNAGDRGAARQELERAIAQSERLGLKGLLAKSHFLLAVTLRSGQNESEALRHKAEARRLLDEIRKEAGSDDVLTRADLSPIAKS